MTVEPDNLFWDSCVFIYFITKHPEFIDDIRAYVRDAKAGSAIIHYSTISLTEIKPSFFRNSDYANIEEFFDDFEGAFSPISPTPDILIRAGSLRDKQYVHARKDPRVLGTGDAILLMSAVHLTTVRGVKNVVFHTYDNGGKRSSEDGKCVPLLTFEEWTAACDDHFLVRQVRDLKRARPVHPNPSLL